MKSKKVIKKVKKKGISVFFKENYSKSWSYIKESKNFIWAVLILFLISVGIGFLYQPPELIKTILSYIQEILTKTEGFSPLQMIGFIFSNNIQSSFIGLMFGFAIGIFPVFSTIANGYVIGYVSSSVVTSSGASSLLNLIPHGIFELPAIFISFGMGIKFGSFVFYKERLKYFNKFFIESLRVFVFIVLPLLVIAAIIEGSLIFL